MNQKLLISYSRRQTPFVDRLADQLEDGGYSLWLDYQSLVPAKPWKEQIEAGISEADLILLVVSRESLGSKHVELEWQRALEFKKRLILAIFEAVPLPCGLQTCEWVDFRVKYKKGVQQLMKLLASPVSIGTTPPPQSGFQAPWRFWLAMVLSVLVVIGSISSWWTIVIPYILIPLPWKIYKRNYMFSRVVPALLLLPFFWSVTSIMMFSEGNILEGLKWFSNSWGIPTTIFSWALLMVLLTPTMQRRAAPEAARVRFANPLVVDAEKIRPVVFAIDHAAEDGRYAADLRRGLERHGHRRTGDGETPEAVFVLISAYKTGTAYDPERQVLYPIILQVVGNIDPALQRIQWIDFRKGMGNISKLARLLPQPERLLKALAVPPAGSQEIFPFAVNALQYFFLLTGIVGGGGLLTSALSLGALFLEGNPGLEPAFDLLSLIVNILLLSGAVYYSVRGLRLRTGGTSAIYPLLILTIFQAACHSLNFYMLLVTGVTEEAVLTALTAVSIGTMVPLLAFVLGLLIVVPIVLIRWRELYRWLPRHQKNSADRLESLFLLYTPLRRRALILHAFFHALLLFLYLFLGFYNSMDVYWVSFLYAVPFVLFAFGIRWLARRVSI